MSLPIAETDMQTNTLKSRLPAKIALLLGHGSRLQIINSTAALAVINKSPQNVLRC